MQSSTFKWSFLFPYFLTAAFANFAGKLMPTASAAFIMYSNERFPSGLQMFWKTLLMASSESGFPFSWWVFYPKYAVSFWPLRNLPSACLLISGLVASTGLLEYVLVRPVTKETGTLLLNFLVTKLTTSWETDASLDLDLLVLALDFLIEYDLFDAINKLNLDWKSWI